MVSIVFLLAKMIIERKQLWKMRFALKFGAKLIQAEGSAEIDTGRQGWSWCVWETNHEYGVGLKGI